MKVTNSNRFYLHGTENRFLHMATVVDNLREYMCFVDTSTNKCYIEEITGGQLSFIEEDKIVEEIADLLYKQHITDIRYGIAAPDKEE